MARPASDPRGLFAVLALASGCPLVTDADLAARQDLDGDGVPRPEDCDDADPSLGAPSTSYADADGDGYGTGEAIVACDSAGRASQSGDCDEGDPLVNPSNSWYPDADGDGYGAPNGGVLTCAPEAGWVVNQDDCDDACDTCHTGAVEACGDEVDNDCDGVIAGECALSGEVYADEAEATFLPPEGETWLGYQLGSPGDINGDGRADLLMGTSSVAYLVTTPGSGVRGVGEGDVRFSGAHTIGTGVGDGNGDGVADVLLREGWNLNLFSGPITSVADVVAAASIDTEPVGVQTSTLAWLGDVTGDGVDDIGLGLSGGVDASTRGYVFAGPFAQNRNLDDALATLTAVGESQRFSIGGPGDLNGDGIDDLLIGAPWSTEVESPSGTQGAAYVELGGALTSGSVADADFVVLFGETPPYSTSYLGLAVSGGDTDGDGYADAVLLASQPGAVVLSGATLQTGTVEAVATAVFHINGHGTAVSVADINGDDRDDVQVTGEAGVFLVAGPMAGILELPGEEAAVLVNEAGGYFGYALTAADVNADGFDDVLVGDIDGSTEPGMQAGAAFLFLGGG